MLALLLTLCHLPTKTGNPTSLVAVNPSIRHSLNGYHNYVKLDPSQNSMTDIVQLSAIVYTCRDMSESTLNSHRKLNILTLQKAPPDLGLTSFHTR